MILCVFFFNDTAPTEIYTLSLHDALPICGGTLNEFLALGPAVWREVRGNISRLLRSDEPALRDNAALRERSEEHTSELQSRFDLVCRLLLEKKKSYISDSQASTR